MKPLNSLMLAGLVALAATASTPVLAQGASAPAASPAKKELIAKVLQIQQPQIENIARALAEQSIAPLVQQVGMVLQTRVAADKRDAVAKDVQAAIKKYGDEVVPLLRDRAVKLAPTTIGPMLEEKFSEDELRQLITILESPVQKKYAQMNNDLGQALAQKLVAETRSAVEPKLQALQQNLAKQLGGPAGADEGGKPASAPAKKK